MQIAEVAFIGYPVTDAERARKFYEGVLGLSPSRTFGGGDSVWIEYDLGDTTFAISNMAKENWKPSPDGSIVAFEVVDFDAAIAELKANKILFEHEPMETPVCWMAVIADPDGNKLTVHKRHG
ncbi:MAG TPA: VOC family protein [Chthoniobacterales bacterium]|jgi:predicted enzyme related to lactoylglutathione lyase|nr:VOC family protein [Chthoniobacterales bacterium]